MNIDECQELITPVDREMMYLHSRWQDESKYEDFAEYANRMKSAAEKIPGVTFIAARKRPFGFDFSVEEKKYRYTVSIRGNKILIKVAELYD